MIPELAALAPRKARQVVYVVTSKPDSFNRSSFTALWFDPDVNRPRGQCFHANLDAIVRNDKKAGYRVTIHRQL